MSRLSRFCAAGCVAALALVACGSPSVATHTATARPTPSPTPTPQPPDTQNVELVSSGLGVYQAVVVTVAVLHNAAIRTGVSGVIVHFVPTRSGRPLTPLDSPAVTLYPGETLAVTAYCTDTCNNTGTTADPDAVVVTVGTGTWAPLPGAPLIVGPATTTCVVKGCLGHGQWDLSANVGSPELTEGTRVDLFAWCSDAAGRIIGGGQRSLPWPQAGGSLNLEVPTILSAPPASCLVGASAPI